VIADYAVDIQRSYIAPSGRAEPDRVNALLGELEQQALRELAQAGLRAGDVEFTRLLAVCYPGQTFDLAVPAVLDARARMGPDDLRATIAAFHDLHEETHTYAARDEEPIVRAVRVQALGRTPKPPVRPLPRAARPLADALAGRRPAFFDGRFVDTPVYDGERVGHGHRLEGPAIVEERFTTIVLYPGHVAEVDAHGNYVVSLPV
jgi:N-methylhydantoinase A